MKTLYTIKILFIRISRPKLNTQSNSIRAKKQIAGYLVLDQDSVENNMQIITTAEKTLRSWKIK